MFGWIVAAALAVEPVVERDAGDRVTVEVYGGALIKHPGGFSEGAAFGVEVARPLVFRDWGALEGDVSVRGGVMADGSATFQPTTAVSAGVDLRLVRWFSLAVHLGPAAGAQVGPDGATGLVGFEAGGGYVFRPLRDEAVRFGLTLHSLRAFATAPDPGNDCPLCTGSLGVGLSFQTPI